MPKKTGNSCKGSWHNQESNHFKPSTDEVITDQAEQHDDLKCDICEYMCKKKKTILKSTWIPSTTIIVNC